MAPASSVRSAFTSTTRRAAAGLAVLAAAGLLAACSSPDGSSRGGTGPALLDVAPDPIAALPLGDAGVLVDPSPLPADRQIADLTAPGAVAWGTAAPVVIDTRDFAQQIVPVTVDPDQVRRIKVHLPPHERPAPEPDPVQPRNDFPLGGLLGAPVVDAGSISEFTGITQTAWSPPDPTLAVGPNHVVVTVNQSIAWYTRAGVQQFQQVLGSQGSPGFFEPQGAGNFTFDPKCFYDHQAQRFVVLALEVYTSTAYLTLAVSDDADPNGVWFKYRTDAVLNIDGTTYWWDYPGFGYDDEAFYVTSNLFPLQGPGGFGGAGFRVYDKSRMINGLPVTFATLRDGNSSSVQAAQHFAEPGASNPAAYFVRSNGGNSLRVHAIRNPLTNPTLVNQNVAVPFHNGPQNAPVVGNGEIDTGILGTRIMNVVWRDGQIWCAHSVAQNGVGKPRWYQMDTQGWPDQNFVDLAQSGTIDPGPNVWGFFPSIYVNDQGSVGFGYGTSSANERIRFWVTGRRAGDPAGTMGQPVLVRESSTSGTTGRWGDYYDMALDPNDGLTFWAIGQTADSGGWRSRVASFTIPGVTCPADLVAPFGVVDLADINAFVIAFQGGLPDADFAPPTGVFDLQDINAFVQAFAAGCP